MSRRALSLCAVMTAAAATLAIAQPGSAAPKGPAFNAPAKVTPTGAGGYEPAVVSDSYGNLYATAHKENAELVFSPDPRSSTATRSMSWAWYSDDHGKSWKNLPGPAAGPISPDLQNHNFGDEGDMSVDDDNNISFVDTNVADITFTSWHSTGLGKITFTSHLPTVGFGEPVDDRPWVASHLKGHVLYFGNEGNKNQYPLGQSGEAFGPGSGPGRYTVYSSYDNGKTWDHLGISLKDSGWCRPAAAPHSTYVYAFCGNDSGKLYSFVSKNDGKFWTRYDVPGGYNVASGGWNTFPSVQVLKDGTVWAFYLQPTDLKGAVPSHAQFAAYRSTDHGKTFKRFDISPTQSSYQYEYGSLAVTPDGKKLGYAVYGRPAKDAPWRVYATTFTLGKKPTLTSLDQANPVTVAGYSEAPGDLLQATFDPNGKLTAVWTRAVIQSAQVSRSLFRDIYSATSN